MIFNGPIIRPTTDADSVFIELTAGCTHNGCTFCNFYDGVPLRVAPLSEVEANLKEVAQKNPNAKKVWASGGNPYALSTEKLAERAKLIKKHLPEGHISTYARVDDLNRKTVDDMRHLKELGFGELVIGVESLDDEVLAHVNKGYTVADIVEGFQKLEDAGVDYRVIYMGGLAGQGKVVDSAKKSAEILNKLHPYMMFLTPLDIEPGTPLAAEVKSGTFKPVERKELLQEYKTLFSELHNPMIVYTTTSHYSRPFTAKIPEHKEQVIRMLDEEILSIG